MLGNEVQLLVFTLTCAALSSVQSESTVVLPDEPLLRSRACTSRSTLVQRKGGTARARSKTKYPLSRCLTCHPDHTSAKTMFSQKGLQLRLTHSRSSSFSRALGSRSPFLLPMPPEHENRRRDLACGTTRGRESSGAQGDGLLQVSGATLHAGARGVLSEGKRGVNQQHGGKKEISSWTVRT